MCVYIFAGRFQPFHNGHMQVLRELCEIATQRDTIVIGVVAPFISSNIKDVEFLNSSLEHHLPERNPWNVSICLSAVSRIAKLIHRENILTTLIPRPEYGYDTISEWFPEKRIWIIPNAGENFDENKAAFFKKMGDAVIRLNDTTNISGRALREYYKTNQFKKFYDCVPESVAEIYFKNRIQHNSEQDFQSRAKSYEQRSSFVKDESCNGIPISLFSKHNHKVGKLLDAGAGTGYLSWYIKQNTSVESITLVDTSYNMLQEAKKKDNFFTITHNTSIETFCNLSANKYDTILIRQVLHYVQDVDIVLSRLRNLLEDDGVVYIGQIVLKNYETQKWHDELMKEISENRRRSFVYSDLISIINRNGYSVVDSIITDYTDDLTELIGRRSQDYQPSTIEELISKMKHFATPEVKESINLQTNNHDLHYTVQFCHLLLRKAE